MSASFKYAFSRDPSVNALSHLGSTLLNAVKVCSLIDPTTQPGPPSSLTLERGVLGIHVGLLLLGFHAQFSKRRAQQSPLPSSSLRYFTYSRMTPSGFRRVFSDRSKASKLFPGSLWTSDLLLSLSSRHLIAEDRSSTWFCRAWHV